MGRKEAAATKIVLAAASIFLLAAGMVSGRYSGGDGSPQNPYRIATPNDLNDIGNHIEDFNKHFVMVNDINLAAYTGTQFNIIGPNSALSFTGFFDGNNHTISNFSYSGTDRSYVGLFGRTGDLPADVGQIRNLTLADVNVNAGTGHRVGGLVGYSRGSVINCRVNRGIVRGRNDTGGLVGYISYNVVVNCSASCKVEGGINAGGLAGCNDKQMIQCYATGQVTGDEEVGGLVGYLGGTVTKCYVEDCNVWGGYQIAGLAGVNYGNVVSSYSTGTVSGQHNFVGGLLGENRGLGGPTTVSNSYSTVTVSGDRYVGGLVGYNLYGEISSSYSTGAVSGSDYVGGLVGRTYHGTAANCFWDTQTSGMATSDGGTGKTTAEMQTKSTFTDAGWDFVGETVNGPNDIWTIHETVDYPKHVWKLVNFVGWNGVDFADYSYLADHWQESDCGGSNDCNGTDLDFSDDVDWADVKIFCQHWLEAK